MRNSEIKSESGTTTRIPLKGAKKVVAQRMLQSHQNTPAVTIFAEAKINDLVKLRRELNENSLSDLGAKISYTHIFIKALAQTLSKHPMINSQIHDDEIVLYQEINIGVAAALPDGGLIVPVVKNTDKKSIHEVADEVSRLSEATRNSSLAITDLRDGTFTLSNVGILPNMMWQTPLINQNQCAILAVGSVRKEPVVVGEEVVPGYKLCVSLSFDHRIVNGVPAARFLNDFISLLEYPANIELKI